MRAAPDSRPVGSSWVGLGWEQGQAARRCLLVERFPDLLKVSLASILSIGNTRKNASSLTAVKLP